jgi:hypothetical protein
MTIQAVLKVQLIEAVPDMFINKLCNKILQYSNTTAFAIFYHLEITYGTVIPVNLIQNSNAVHHPWSLEQLLKDLFKQICICHAFAKNHGPAVKHSLQSTPCPETWKILACF